MISIKGLLASVLCAPSSRTRPRIGPACEALEGRRLLNGAWSWPGPGTIGLDHLKAAGTVHVQPASRPALSASALAEMKTLQSDTQTFQAEIKAKVPAPLLDALKQDAAEIAKALGTTAKAWSGKEYMTGNDPSIDVIRRRPHFDGPAPGAEVPMTGPTSFPASMVTKLEAAGVTAAQVSRFESDAKALQAAISKVDPALMAKIQADHQAFAEDAPPPSMHFDHIKAMTVSPARTPRLAREANL